ASDPDIPAQNLVFSLGADDCSFTPSINANTGLVSWTCGSSTESCTIPVTVTDDGTPNRADTANLTAQCTNIPPAFTTTAPTSAVENVQTQYAITCTDGDGDAVNLTRGPADSCGGAL